MAVVVVVAAAAAVAGVAVGVFFLLSPYFNGRARWRIKTWAQKVPHFSSYAPMINFFFFFCRQMVVKVEFFLLRLIAGGG